MSGAREWLVRVLPHADGGQEVLAPAVGWWMDAPARGTLLGPGDAAGRLVVLGAAHVLRLPAEVAGEVVSDPPALMRAPVGAGDVLFRLTAGAARATAAAAAPQAGGATRLLLRAPQAGRFWRRPEPKAPFYAAEGEVLEAGRTFGLLEVMKTFQPAKYRPSEGLPARVRLMRWLVADGAEVSEQEAVAELEPA